jgi:hypothetical protein
VLDSVFDWMPLSKVEEITGFSERRLRKLVRDHAIPVMKSGREIRFDQLSMKALKEAIRLRPSGSNRPPRTRHVPCRRSGQSELDAALAATTPSPPSRRRRP